MKNHCIKYHFQKGGALIIFVLVLVVVGVATILSGLDGTDVKIEREKKTAEALAEAKAALIGYASVHQRPGSLPCPDTNNDGVTNPNGNISCYSNIGRLPWKTLGIDDIRDGNGERIWYAVSSNFATVPSSQIINSDDTIGSLNICPANGCGDASPIPTVPSAPFPIFSKQAAIVFSAGVLLSGQDRQDGVDLNPNPALNIDNAKKSNNFLDFVSVGANNFNNATGSNNGNDFILGSITSSFNDRLLSVSADEIFGNIDQRMQAKSTLSEIASCLIQYANNNTNAIDKRLPWAAPLTMASYTDVISFDDDPNRYTGRIAYHIADSTGATPVHGWDTGVATKKRKMEYCSNWPSWWNSWKNNVFYAVSKNYAPDISAPQICSVNNCVTVDGVGPFAAILFFSGKKLAGQTRVSNADIANPSNFLEDKNAVEMISNSGAGDYTRITNPAQNDVLICIRQNLTIDTACATP